MITILTLLLTPVWFTGLDANPFDLEEPAVLAVPQAAAPETSTESIASPTATALARSPIAVPVELLLVDGRTLRGRLDQRTDGQALWLAHVRPGIEIARSVAWAKIEQVTLAGQPFSAEEMLAMVRQIRSELPPEPVVRHVSIVGTARPVQPAALPPCVKAARRVASIDVDVSVAHWDSDVEADGLLVRLYPRDETGASVCVDGLVEAELYGERTSGAKWPQPPARLGLWSQSIASADCGPNGIVLRLPFQSAHPEFDPSLLPRGLVHVKLSVPGQGTFEASDAMVRIRPYSSVRDRLELGLGRRFFPTETTERGRW